jgi:TrmH family RNA methyltransferase
VKNKILTSTNNPLIKKVRKLHRSKVRQEQNLLLLEGTNLIQAACQVNYKLDLVFCTCQWQENYPQLWQTLIARTDVQLVSTEVLNSIATTIHPDGVIALAEIVLPHMPEIADNRLSLAVERLQDPGNLGTIIRTAVATNVDALWLSQDSVAIDNPKVLRASAGEWFRLPIAVTNNLKSIVQEHQQQGIQVIATIPQATTIYWSLDFHRPSLLLIGNEGQGLSEELIALADKRVAIPLCNQVESLNVAIATALLLYEASRQNSNLCLP